MNIRSAFARSIWPVVLAVPALGLLSPRSSEASLIVSVQSVTVGANTTGDSFDVTLMNTGPAAVTVGGFSFEIKTTAPGITFTRATTATTSPYIFDGLGLFGSPINTTSGTTLNASDLFSVIGSGTTLAAGATVGLGHVIFNVGATGGTVTLTGYPATSLSDTSFPTPKNIPINTLQNGTITVTGAAVPEPSSLALCGLGCTILGLGHGRRRRSRAAA